MSQQNPPLASGTQQAELARFTLSNPLEILQHLHSIAELKQAVTVFSNKGNSFIVTRLLDVDVPRGVLVFGMSADDGSNQKLLASERNVLVTAPAGVKTQFICGPAEEVTYDGRRAFEMPLPEKIIRLQRREFYRIHSPLTKPVWCRLHEPPGRVLPLFDISLGGVALSLSLDQHAWLQPGQVLSQVDIDLPGVGLLQVGLEVRHVMLISARDGQEHYRAGCTFIGMNMARETLVQRYITHLERERRALVR
ncbi:flagellar brake protein [Vogesella facilis]|uniref:Flagellar brake protein YcgR n=1 Tax=Vogesella facilis TaxID=1655232 RepID=A0ABV7RFD9_9NEIS